MSISFGIGNVVRPDTKVFHGGITSRDTFGRLTDLVVAWTKKEHNLSEKISGEMRVLIQEMLEFTFLKKSTGVGHLELAIENELILIGIRFDNSLVSATDDPEKKIEEHWMSSEEGRGLNKILNPQDQVEVLYSKDLNTLEWRVIRPTGLHPVNSDSPMFQVFCNVDKALTTGHQNYVEMGDVPYEDWIAEVYRNRRPKNKSGELNYQGESLQNEDEWTRVVIEREKKTIEDTVKVNSEKRESGSIAKEDETVSVPQREVVALTEKLKLYEELLRQKLRQQHKLEGDLATVQKKLKNFSSDAEMSGLRQAEMFKEKAKQMYEMVKTLQFEKHELEKVVSELKNAPQISAEPALKIEGMEEGLHPDELVKKIDRLARALDAERNKAKSLTDRMAAMEKEIISSGPLIQSLESKIEAASKGSESHKREVEQLKQKLVHAEGEKNKVKNELLKAQAQIQTMMKRQAS